MGSSSDVLTKRDWKPLGALRVDYIVTESHDMVIQSRYIVAKNLAVIQNPPMVTRLLTC